jgi:hypothetical protein
VKRSYDEQEEERRKGVNRALRDTAAAAAPTLDWERVMARVLAEEARIAAEERDAAARIAAKHA